MTTAILPSAPSQDSPGSDRAEFTARDSKIAARSLAALVRGRGKPGARERAALARLLGITLGRTAEEALRVPVYFHEVPTHRPDDAVCLVVGLGDGIARYWFDLPSDAYVPEPDHVRYLVPHVDFVDLVLPPVVIQKLKTWAARRKVEGMTVGELLRMDFTAFAKARPALNRYLRHQGLLQQVGERRFANILGAAVERTSGDTVIARRLSSAGGREPAIYYYVSHPIEQVPAIYLRAIRYLLLEDEVPAGQRDFPGLNLAGEMSPRVGSHLYATEAARRCLQEGLYQDAKDARRHLKNPNNLARAHNTTVAYVLTLFVTLTAARIVKDLFCRRSAFLPGMNAIAVSDKHKSPAHAGRAVIAPDIVFKQLEAYWKHLDSVAAWLEDRGSPVAATVRSLLDSPEPRMPAFFWLNEDLTDYESVTATSLLKYHRRYWPLPANALRHRLAADLLQAGVPVEYAEFQLGHRPGGEGPFDPYSTLSLRALRDVLKPVLEQIAARQGWQVLPGVRPYGQKKFRRGG